MQLTNKKLKELAFELNAIKFSDKFNNDILQFNAYKAKNKLYSDVICYSIGQYGVNGKIVQLYSYDKNGYIDIKEYIYTSSRNYGIYM